MESISQCLSGPYGGLYGEVVTCDCYKLRTLDLNPEVVVDIGANIGIFSRFARGLWPKAVIIAVEPHPDNIDRLRAYSANEHICLLPVALGNGKGLYRGLTAPNGSGESYLSPGLGFPQETMAALARDRNGIECARVETMMLDEILMPWLGKRMVLKIDCEGAENCIWGHAASMQALARADYIAMELHDYAINGADVPTVKEVTSRALASLETTHVCVREGVYFWARKRV